MSLILPRQGGTNSLYMSLDTINVGKGGMNIKKMLKVYLKLLVSNPKALILLLLITVSLAGAALGKPEVSPLDGSNNNNPGTPYPHPDPT